MVGFRAMLGCDARDIRSPAHRRAGSSSHLTARYQQASLHYVIEQLFAGVGEELDWVRARYILVVVRMYSVQCALHTVQCTMYTVHCTPYSVHCMPCTVYGTLAHTYIRTMNKETIDEGHDKTYFY